jgi:hypothetical protein
MSVVRKTNPKVSRAMDITNAIQQLVFAVPVKYNTKCLWQNLSIRFACEYECRPTVHHELELWRDRNCKNTSNLYWVRTLIESWQNILMSSSVSPRKLLKIDHCSPLSDYKNVVVEMASLNNLRHEHRMTRLINFIEQRPQSLNYPRNAPALIELKGCRIWGSHSWGYE